MSVEEQWATGPRVAECERFYAIPDGYPVSEGHTLVVAKRKVPDMLWLCNDECEELLHFVKEVCAELAMQYDCDGFNIGANCGASAGQTVMQFHLHIIPRYKDDGGQPGGVRHVLPGGDWRGRCTESS